MPSRTVVKSIGNIGAARPHRPGTARTPGAARRRPAGPAKRTSEGSGRRDGPSAGAGDHGPRPPFDALIWDDVGAEGRIRPWRT